MKNQLNIQSQGRIPKEDEIAIFENEIGVRLGFVA